MTAHHAHSPRWFSHKKAQKTAKTERYFFCASLRLFAAILPAGVLALPSFAHAATPAVSLAQKIQPFFDQHCASCHAGDEKEGNFSVDLLTPKFDDHLNALRWEKVFDKIATGEMPPKKKARPPEHDRSAVVDWIGAQLKAESAQRYQAEGRAQRRRLNRVEHENTLRDLLSAEIRIASLLPEDGRAHGFDTVDEALSMSTVQMEKYLEATDRALDVALGAKAPAPFKRESFTFITPEKSLAITRDRFERGLLLEDSAVIFVTNGENQPWFIREFGAPEPGRYKVRVTASAYQSEGKPLTMRIYDGYFLPGGSGKRITGYYEIPADKPTTVEAEVFLESPRDTFRILPYDLPGRGNKAGQKDYRGPGLRVYGIEIEGPLEAAQWPPRSRTALLGDIDPTKATEANAHAILRRFAPRAFRRPISDAELAPYLAFATDRLKAGGTFEQAVRAGLKSILVSPRFIMLDSSAGKLDGHALASRLSYFLWSTMPDEALLAAAVSGELTQPAKLRAEVDRMLRDPKAATFTKNFTDQWLELKQIDATTPDKQLYPEFDEWLQVSMIKETRDFFDEVLRNDLSVLSFIDSDWGVFNQRLAEHYGLRDSKNAPLVTGLTHRRVTLPPGSHRGGVLTHGSILKVTANGTTTSPVIRGAWLLDRVLGTPIPPPPANVPAVEPDIRGATNIREQLAKHRELGACASCHIKMDPVGFALENYDVIGGWRDRYRILPPEDPNADAQAKKAKQQAKQEKRFAQGARIDSADTLPTGESFRDVDEFKRHILSRPEPIVRGLTEKLIIYGTGHAIEFSDRDAVEHIAQQAAKNNYGFRSLIHAVVQSDIFLNK